MIYSYLPIDWHVTGLNPLVTAGYMHTILSYKVNLCLLHTKQEGQERAVLNTKPLKAEVLAKS